MQVKVISNNDKKLFQEELQNFLDIVKGQRINDIKFSTSNDRGCGVEYAAIVLYEKILNEY